MLINSSETHSEVVSGKWASKIDRIVWVRLVSHIYENPVETEVDLIARISPVFVNFEKYVRYICTHSHRSLCVTSTMTMISQLARSTAVVNYSKIIQLKYTAVIFAECVKNDSTKFKILFKLEFFKY
jgi:hypothetical protein